MTVVSPIALYADALTARDDAVGLSLRYADGRVVMVDVDRWRQLDVADLELLARCTDPTLDVGCGVGRLVAALNGVGRSALGVDIAERAVSIAQRAGATVVCCSVFDALPDTGSWRTVLLADGNIGIGGDPVQLLRRCRELLAPNGHLLVELDPPGSPSRSVQVRLEVAAAHSEWFTWAHMACDNVAATAADTGLRVEEVWQRGGRWFACLVR